MYRSISFLLDESRRKKLRRKLGKVTFNITSVARTAGSALTAQTASDARKPGLSNATPSVKPGDNFYPTA